MGPCRGWLPSSADGMPGPEEDSTDDEDAQPTIYAARLVKKCRDEWCPGGPFAFTPLLKASKSEGKAFYTKLGDESDSDSNFW